MWGASLESVGGWGGVSLESVGVCVIRECGGASLESVGGASESVGGSLVVACTRCCMHHCTRATCILHRLCPIWHTIISIINSMAKSAIWD